MLLHQFIQQYSSLSDTSITNTIQLLEEDCTIPFIARYRKERTGNLDEVAIAQIVQLKEQFEAISKRKESILKNLEEQEVLTTELKATIENTYDLTTLEDLYLPYKKKRKTKAETARKNGLEPLAKIIMSQKPNDIETIAHRYVQGNITSNAEALEGARHIIAEWISERASIRNMIRHQLNRFSALFSKVIKAKEKDEKALKYKDYFDWSEPLHKIPSHRLLAILRAEKEGFLRVKVEIDDERTLEKIVQKNIKSNGVCAHEIELAIKDAYKRLLLPSLSNEALNNAKEKADETAILVFAKNLEQLLLGAPLGEKRILAIDPGYRTGCKIVCLDQQGNLKHNETIYPHAPKNDTKGAMKKISSLVDAHKIQAIAIGNGTASRETERLIRKMTFKHDIQVFVVSEAGASIYSASKIAREEFPNYDITVRGAVSIGRRLADPLAELVKIDAKSIGVGQYQHDVDQNQLQKSLHQVVENVVNKVGVNLNTASASLLSYVSGIGPKMAENIIDYRTKNGAFSSINELKKVHRLGEKAFQQSAGFLRIKNAKNPLDDSAVHPERYDLVNRMAQDAHISIDNLIGNAQAIANIPLDDYCTSDIGVPTLQDILKELEKPGLDPREQAKVFTFNQNIKTINDIQIGQKLPGIVNNITNFGCFVDIGIKESGLIHISNLTDGFVSDVNSIVHLHQQVIVKVLEIDESRKRIQLKLMEK